MGEFKIKLQDLETGLVQRDFAVSPDWVARMLVDAELTAQAPGELKVTAQLSAEEVIVGASVKAELTGTCVRCLEAAHIPVDHEFSIVLSPAPASVLAAQAASAASSGSDSAKAGAAKAALRQKRRKNDAMEEVELSAADLDQDYYSGDTVELDDVVRDQLILECPMNPLCAEDCTGINHPGRKTAEEADVESIDPRLAPLKAIAQRLGRNEE